MKINLKDSEKTLFLKTFFLEFLFLIITFISGKFFIKKIYTLVITMHSLQENIEQLQNFNIENATLAEITSLREIVTQVNFSINQLILYIIFFIITIFLIYVIIKSIQWNIIYHEKLTNFKKYFFKFTILSAFLFIILGASLFNILRYSRTFLISYMFESTFLTGPIIRLITLILSALIMTHLFFTSYVYLNKHNLLNSVKEMLKFRKFYLFFILVGVFITSSIIVRYGLILNQSSISFLIQGTLISLLFTMYKLHLTRKLKSA